MAMSKPNQEQESWWKDVGEPCACLSCTNLYDNKVYGKVKDFPLVSTTSKVVTSRDKIEDEDKWLQNIMVTLAHTIGCTHCGKIFKLDTVDVAKLARQHILECTSGKRASVWHVCLNCGKREADRVELLRVEKELGFM